MQTILGSGGAIANELAKELRTYASTLRLVSRHPEKINDDDELFTADLTKLDQVREATKGSTIVYLTAGLKYRSGVWEEKWPKIMANVIQSCKDNSCKLVFFDNVYMYDPNYMEHMTEDTPIRPVSRKGKVRAQVAKMLLDEVSQNNMDALIARSADFYGPSIALKSLLTEMVFKPLSQSKSAKWLSSIHYPHSFTFTPDAGKAVALLGNTPKAFNQVWHLPTASSPLTGKEWIYLIAKEMGKSPEYQVIPSWFVKASGWFVPFMRELDEMLYQYDRPYVFDSTKFQEYFFFKPTSYLEGIRKTIHADFPKLEKKKNDLMA